MLYCVDEGEREGERKRLGRKRKWYEYRLLGIEIQDARALRR